MDTRTATPPPAARRWLRPLALGLLVLALLGWALARGVDAGRLVSLCASASPAALGAMLLLHLAANAVRALRLHVVLQNPRGAAHSFHVYNAGLLVNCLLPLRAGELAMALLLGPGLPGGRSGALSRLFVDRLMDVLTVMAMFLGALWMAGGGADRLAPGRALVQGLVALGLVLGLMVLVCACEGWLLRAVRFAAGRLAGRDPRPWEARFMAVVEGLRTLFRGRVLAKAGPLSLLGWSAVVLAYMAGMQSLFEPPGLVAALFAVCLTVLGLMAAPMPAGLGTIHGAIVLALGLFGVGAEQALAFAVLYQGLTTLASVLLGLVSAQRLGLGLGGLLRLARSTTGRDGSQGA